MRFVVVCVVAALASAAGSAADTNIRTALTVTYWKEGAATTKPIVWTVRCNPPRGTLPRPGAACRRLTAVGAKLFAAVPKDAVCTQIYGGPQVALVTGLVNGRWIHTRLQRRNGCEIARWNRLSPWLLPRGGVD